MTSLLILQAGGSPYSMLIMFGAIFVVMYFFMIRPQQKKQKEQKLFQEGLDKGAKVVTVSGIHGKIVKVNELTFEIEVANNAVMTFEKSAVSLEVSKAVYGDK
jgi:preprotein translocase subunit YajC